MGDLGHLKMTNFSENPDCVGMVESIQLFEDRWKQRANCDKTKMYNHIMELSSSKAPEHSDTECLSLCSKRNEPERDKQYASYVVFMENNKDVISQPVYPDFKNRKIESDAQYTKPDQRGLSIKRATTHSEEILIEQLDDFLTQNETKVKQILIYTHNSPCLKRENNIVPCMFRLLYKACEWYEHSKALTHVVFSKPWGLSGPNYFKNLNYSMISSPRSDFHSYIEKCKDIHFKLDHNNLRGIFKKSDIYNTLSQVKDEDKNTLHSNIKSAREKLVSLAQSSSGLRNDHLQRGKQMIDSFEFLPGVRNKVYERLQMEWKEMVNNSSMTPIREVIAEEFNNGVVHLFREYLKSFLGSRCPLRLHYHHVRICFCP